jgi:beta-alanine--pyruvate transaminase
MDMTDAAHLPTYTPATQPRTDADWLAAHWMPYTGNREFKANPRLMVSAKGAYYTDMHGKQVFDGLSGLWCTGLGHGRDEITRAVARQMGTLDYSPAFQFGHPLSFELANAIVERMPAGLNRKTRLIGRVKGYHGVNFGGISVGGIVGNRKLFGQGVEADHLHHTQPPAGSFFKGMPPAEGQASGYKGAALADELLDLINLHDASNIAAVIVEPFSGSAGVVIPPQGYLQRLREICTAHNILLIFDEVISGFGRSGAWTGAEAFGVTPDILNFAKQVTNGTQPLGGVVVKQEIHDTFMAAGGPGYMLEFPHGYTYGAHPVACAAGIASMQLLAQDDAPQRVRELAPHFEAAVHGLRGAQHVLDIRNFGLAAGFSIAPVPGEPAKRPYDIAMAMLAKGYYVRYGGDTIQLAPPFISTPTQIDSLVSALGDTLQSTD